MPFIDLPKGTEFSESVAADRRRNAEMAFQRIAEVANQHGYAIARHGSGVRDIDLLAAPWTDDVISPTDLVLKLMAALSLTMGAYTYDKPHGRASFALWFPEWPDHQIDLSVMPIR
jgi:hypothetical protein